VDDGRIEASSFAYQCAPKTIYDIFKSSTDWEFILKIDGLLEATARKVVKVALAANEPNNQLVLIHDNPSDQRREGAAIP